jgi:Ca2+-binding RTX toxin-like protein
VTLSDTTLAATLLNTLSGRTTGVVNAASVTELTGAAADVRAAYAAGAAEITGLGNEAVTLSGTTAAAADLIAIDAATSVTVDASTLTTLTGTAAEVNAAYAANTAATISGLGNEAVTLSDTTLASTALNALDGSTSGVVDATSMTATSGLVVDVKTAIASAGINTSTTYAATLTDPSVSVADLNTVTADTTGIVTATLDAGALADFAVLGTASNDLITINVNDAGGSTLSALALSTLGGKTAGVVTVQNAVTVSGTVSQLTAALVTTETRVTAATANVVASDSGSVAAASLVAIDGVTSGLITAANVGTLTGNAAEVRGVTDNLATSGSNKFSIGAMVGSVTNAAVTLTGTATLADLRAIDQSASGMITAADVTSLSGTVTDVRAVLDNLGTGSNKFSLGTMTDNVTDVGLTLTDTTMTAANVLLLDTATTGVVTIAAGSTVTGTQTEINSLFGATGVSRPGDLSVTVTGVLLSGTDFPGYLDFIGANTTGTIGVEGSVDANPLNFSAMGQRLVIDGGAGNDTITGTGYGDRLIGGAGNDGITLGAGADVLVFNSLSGSDTVAGFNVAADQIELAKAVMTGLGNVNGALTDAQFESGAGLTAAVDTTTRIFYNETTGALYYDADGSAAGAAVQLATFTSAPLLTYQDFLIA